MSCIDKQDSLVEYVLGELDAASRGELEQHLATGCNQCAAELRVLTESVDVLWQAVPNRKLSLELQRSIVARACAVTPASGLAVHETPSTLPDSKFVQLIRNPILQALFAFAAGLLFMVYMNAGANDAGRELSNRHAALQSGSHVNLASPQIPATLEISEKKYESTHLVSLRRNLDSNELRGHVLWDTLTREIHIYCYGLQQPPHGTQYALWLIGPGIEVRAAERLEVDSQGVCKAAVHWPEGDFRYAKVTLEPSSKLNSRPSNDVALTSNAIEPLSN